MPRVAIHQQSPILDIHIAKDERLDPSILVPLGGGNSFFVLRIGSTTVFCSVDQAQKLCTDIAALFPDLRVRPVPQQGDSQSDPAGVAV